MAKTSELSPFATAPLNALRAFHLAATNGSFGAAARYLGIGQSTVSRHVVTLEDWLGVTLFERGSSSTSLTADGRRLHAATRACFEDLDSVLASELSSRAHGALVVDVSVSFAVLWMLPRIDHFAHQHGDVDLRVVTRPESSDNGDASADVSVKFGIADPSRGDIPLVPEELVVARAAKYDLSLGSDPRNIAANETLLCSTGITSQTWTAILGHSVGTSSPTHPSFMVYLQAVLEAQGLGLACRNLLARHLEAGTLALVGDVHLATSNSYYLSGDRSSHPHAVLFTEWLEACRVGSAGLIVGNDAPHLASGR